jgi:hypothetical protein
MAAIYPRERNERRNDQSYAASSCGPLAGVIGCHSVANSEDSRMKQRTGTKERAPRPLTAEEWRQAELRRRRFMAAHARKWRRAQLWQQQMEELGKHRRPTATEIQVAKALLKSPGGPEWIRRRKALTEGEDLAFYELNREAARRPHDPRPMQAVIVALQNPLGVLELPTLLQDRQRARQGRSDAMTLAVAALARDFPHEKPRALWGLLAQRLGWRPVELGKAVHAELHDDHGCRLTYPDFTQRLGRAKRKRKKPSRPLPSA